MMTLCVCACYFILMRHFRKNVVMFIFFLKQDWLSLDCCRNCSLVGVKTNAVGAGKKVCQMGVWSSLKVAVWNNSSVFKYQLYYPMHELCSLYMLLKFEVCATLMLWSLVPAYLLKCRSEFYAQVKPVPFVFVCVCVCLTTLWWLDTF